MPLPTTRTRRGRLPVLTEGSVTDVADVTPTQHFTEPPPRFTEATLIKALEEHGIGRPSTYAATISTITDRGYVRVEERRLHPEPVAEIVTDFLVEHFGAYVDVEFTARMEEELDEVASGERPWVPMLRAFYDQLRGGHRQGSAMGPTRGDRRGLLARPPDGHQARPERPVPGLLALPGAQGDPAGAGRRAAAPGGHRRGLPGVRRRGRSSARRGRFGPFVGCSRYPDCKYIKKDGPPPPDPLPFEVVCPKNKDGHLVPRRARRTGNVFWGCSQLPDAATSRRTTSRSAACTTSTTARSRARTRRRSASSAGRPAMRLPRDVVPGTKYPGGPANPEALARPARARGGARAGGAAKTGGAVADGARSRRTHHDAANAPGRAGRRRVSGVSAATATDPALARFLRSLAARDASPHTQRAYRTAVGDYLAWLAATRHGLAGADPNGPARLPGRPR